MSTFETVLLMLLVVDAIALAALVLLQQGRGADVGAAFGSGSANTMFGSSGSASFLTKLTVWLALGFFAISFGLAYTAKQKAETMNLLGIPQLEVPLEAASGDADVADPLESREIVDGNAPGAELADDEFPGDGDPAAAPQLTDDAESVDSDIPDV